MKCWVEESELNWKSFGDWCYAYVVREFGVFSLLKQLDRLYKIMYLKYKFKYEFPRRENWYLKLSECTLFCEVKVYYLHCLPFRWTVSCSFPRNSHRLASSYSFSTVCFHGKNSQCLDVRRTGFASLNNLFPCTSSSLCDLPK